jgi:Cu/Ag efflux protein CusF
MKLLTLAAILVTAFAAPAYAQPPADDHSAHHVGQAASDTTLTEGEVRRVDKDANKLTIRHGPILNLDMPAMTMVFLVKDAAMLDKLNNGDKIKFYAERVGGTITVTRIEPAK